MTSSFCLLLTFSHAFLWAGGADRSCSFSSSTLNKRDPMIYRKCTLKAWHTAYFKQMALHISNKSQNHRMVGVGRDLWESSSSTPLPKQGHLQQAAQDLVRVGFKSPQRRRLHSSSGQRVSVLRHPQREEVLPHVQMELPMLQFVPIAPCPVAGHH